MVLSRRLDSVERVIVVCKRSAYDLYVRQHKMKRVRALLRANDPVVARLVRSDEAHRATLDEVRSALKTLGIRAAFRDRSRMGTMEGADLVVCVGGDGTLLSASHGLANTPVLGINSSPEDSVGHLSAGAKGSVLQTLRAAVTGELPIVWVTRMQVHVDGACVHKRVLNEALLAHKNPAMMSRYFLRLGEGMEEHKSSGLWVGPAMGSTAAIHSAGGKVMPVRSQELQYVVREPYMPHGTKYTMLKGRVRATEALEIWNKMREGALFIDGPRSPITLEIGQRVRFSRSDEPLGIVGFVRKR